MITSIPFYLIWLFFNVINLIIAFSSKDYMSGLAWISGICSLSLLIIYKLD